jgi:hypothetical protein
MDELGGLDYGNGTRGVDSLADHLAWAWLVISKIEDGDGRSTRLFPDELPSYVPEDWAKMVARRLSGYAQLHPRPDYAPWGSPEFDGFAWLGET